MKPEAVDIAKTQDWLGHANKGSITGVRLMNSSFPDNMHN